MDTKHESSDVVEDIEPISMMVTDDSDGNTNTRDLDTNGTFHERPMKKPKFELRLPEGFLDPIICDKQQQPMVVVSPVSSTVGENGVRVNEKEKEIVVDTFDIADMLAIRGPDIQIRGARDPKKIEMAKDYPNSRHFLTYRHSFRSYASILYLRIPDNFRIILRGKDVIHHNIVNDMMMSQKITYKPAQPAADGVTKNDKNQMSADVTIGFVKDAKDHIDVQGFNVYHKNRLIKPFWRVWNAAGSNGRGVIGVLEANFVEPAHDKQGFERTTVLQRLENHVKPKPSVGDLSDEDIVSPGTNTSSSKTEVVRPIRNSAALKSVECAQYDAMPEACASTSRKSPFQASSSSKVLKASTNSLHSKVINRVQPLNAFGYASVDPKRARFVWFQDVLTMDYSSLMLLAE
nr:protein microrchidia 7-like [Tanacetum cinerariifolium]